MRFNFITTVLFAFAAVSVAAAPEAGPVILILGPPGSGKTLNAKRISQRYDIPTISMADLLKQAGGWGKAGSKKVFRAAIESGELVSDEVAIKLLEQRLGKEDARRGFVLDGFPATVKQAEYLDNLCKERRFRPPMVVHLTVSDSTATERMRRRGRADDKPAIMERRLAEYHAQADMVLGRYREVAAVDASGTPDEVWRSVEQKLAAVLRH
jgi:adenylate kinase